MVFRCELKIPSFGIIVSLEAKFSICASQPFKIFIFCDLFLYLLSPSFSSSILKSVLKSIYLSVHFLPSWCKFIANRRKNSKLQRVSQRKQATKHFIPPVYAMKERDWWPCQSHTIQTVRILERNNSQNGSHSQPVMCMCKVGPEITCKGKAGPVICPEWRRRKFSSHFKQIKTE